MTDKVVVVGAGGFGRETIDVIRAVGGWELLGVVDDALSALHGTRIAALGIPFLGGLEVLEALPDTTYVAVGVGSPAARGEIVRFLDQSGLRSPSLVHPTAVMGSELSLADGAIICAGVSVGTNVRLGRHAHLNPHSVVGHDTVLADFVSVNPNATISGGCTIETGVLVGAGSVVLQGVRVGERAVVGAASCVVRNAAADVTLVGVPAAVLERDPR